MCLITVACGLRADYPLILAANRDEFFARPTDPARFWPETPHLLAGRDLEQGGTWLGITRNGRIAALTNFRDGTRKRAGRRSRGWLVRDFLLSQQPAAKQVLVAGFSFGSAIALKLGCSDARVHRVVAIAAPAGMYDFGFLAQCAKPKLFVHGDRDDVAPLSLLRDKLERLAVPQADVRVLRGATHFFEGQLDELRAEVQQFASS